MAYLLNRNSQHLSENKQSMGQGKVGKGGIKLLGSMVTSGCQTVALSLTG